MQMSLSFTIDLARISGRGDFNCPKCGTIISPDDSKEEAYELLEAVMKADCVEKLVLRCIRCGSIVELTGFVLLNEIPELPEQPHPPFLCFRKLAYSPCSQ